MEELLDIVDEVDYRTAVCKTSTGTGRCSTPARYSMRIAGGGDTEQVGEHDSYIATCYRHHRIP